jgi:predicted CxxxxCH...CXXCH cytochrome family protein
MIATGIIPGRVLIAILSAFLWGCGAANSDAPSFNTTIGEHPPGWVAVNGGNHRLAFRAAPAQCRRCHGSDILVPGGTGGIAGVSCSSNGFNGLVCHAGGHVPRTPPHVLPFADPSLHGPAAKRDLTICRACHARKFAGTAGDNPRFNVKIGSLISGCEDCHNVNTAHPSTPPPDSAPWRGIVTHRDAANLAVACALCHGADLDGIGGVGPACATCHTGGSPLNSLNCTSCHGSPPTGGVFPNISGNHGVHNALNRVSGVCSTCHENAGIGSLKHFNRTVDVAVSAVYNSKSGAASHDPANATCTNVSCHGGRTTPPWRGGVIDVATQCNLCHRSTVLEPPDQFNSYFSGKHDFHVSGIHLTCIQCHDTGKLVSGHFVNLATTSFEQAPATTVRDVVNYAAGSCTPDNTLGNFSIRCHPAPPLTRVWLRP